MRTAPWDPEYQLPWSEIKAVWDGYWDHSKPFLIEKSPPNLIRTSDIVKWFDPVYFIIMVRNPYAHCEGLMRRNGWDVRVAAEFSAKCLRRQAENAESLERSVVFTYEELVLNTREICEKIESFLPGLGTLNPDAEFELVSIDGYVRRGVTDLNPKKMRALSPHQIREMNEVFKSHRDVMDYWGYEYDEPSMKHTLTHALSKARTVVTSSFPKARRVSREFLKGLARRFT